MATISATSLTIANVNATTVKATVKYTLTPNVIEKLAGTVFSEDIRLIGDDPGVLSDVLVSAFPASAYAVSNATPTVMRTLTRNVLKSAMNEDSGFLVNGAEESDEVFARITLAYAASAPNPPAIPPPTTTNTVNGAWKG